MNSNYCKKFYAYLDNFLFVLINRYVKVEEIEQKKTLNTCYFIFVLLMLVIT